MPGARPEHTTLRLVLGVLSLWGSAYALWVLTFDAGFVADDGSGSAADRFMKMLARGTSVLNALAILLLYGWIALRDTRLAPFDRAAWVFAMMFFYPLAVPVFWYLRIWRKPRSGGPDVEAQGR